MAPDRETSTETRSGRGLLSRISQIILGAREPALSAPSVPASNPSPASASEVIAEAATPPRAPAAPAPDGEADPVAGAHAELRAMQEKLAQSEAERERLAAELLREREGRVEAQRRLAQAESLLREAEEARGASDCGLQDAENRLAQANAILAEAQRLADESARNREAAEIAAAEREAHKRALDEIRESSEARLRAVEQERDEARSRAAELEAKVAALSDELKGVRMRRKRRGGESTPESSQTARLESRLQSLESELISNTATTSAKPTFALRLQSLEAKWAELKARLLPKDQEITSLRKQTEELRAHVQQLEMALARASRIPGAVEGFEHITASAQADPRALPREVADPFYQQVIAPLTVLLASADIVLMNPRLDPGLRDTAEEIKKQGNVLRDIIKAYALPPEAQQSH